MSDSPIKKILGRSKNELGKMAHSGRAKLDLRSLQKDRKRMVEKLGREVLALTESNEISHPGLLKAVSRIQTLDSQIEEIKRIQSNKT